MALTPATPRQIPEHAILDHYDKQTYLGNQYVVPLAGTSLANSESNLLLFRNLGSQTMSSNPYVPGLFINLKKVVCLTVGESALLRFYLNPTVTMNGSAAAAVNARSSYGVGGMHATVTTVPSTSANGTLIDAIGGGYLASSESKSLIVLDPGQSLLVTGFASASITVDGFVGWYEL